MPPPPHKIKRVLDLDMSVRLGSKSGSGDGGVGHVDLDHQHAPCLSLNTYTFPDTEKICLRENIKQIKERTEKASSAASVSRTEVSREYSSTLGDKQSNTVRWSAYVISLCRGGR